MRRATVAASWVARRSDGGTDEHDAQVGARAGSVLYSYIVDRTGSDDAAFVPMTVLLLLGAAPWVNEVGVDSPARPANVERDLAAIGQARLPSPMVS
jgi:hypothetical protein